MLGRINQLAKKQEMQNVFSISAGKRTVGGKSKNIQHHGPIKVIHTVYPQLFTMWALEGINALHLLGKGVGKTTSMLISKCHLSDMQSD